MPLSGECRFVEQLAMHMAEGVVAVEPDGRVAFMNPGAQRLLGWSFSELQGRRLQELMKCERDLGTAGHCLDAAANSDGPRQCHGHAFRRRDGSLLPVACVVAPVIDDGRLTGRVMVFRDLEGQAGHGRDVLMQRLREAQQQLMQSEKMASIGQLAAGIAHEINNPVGYVSSNLATLSQYVDNLLEVIAAYRALESQVPADLPAVMSLRELTERVELDYIAQDARDLLRESQEGVARVRKIVQDLKEFSHIDAGDWKPVDLHLGLDSTLNILHHETKYTAEVVREYGDLPPVECIGTQINQVFLNILINAAQAIERHGTITVRTQSLDPEHVCISISDDGVGMTPEVKQRVFESFYTTKPVGKGTGLGLTISLSIVKKHRGRIEVESAPGKGTTFRIILPVHRSENQAHQ